MEHIGGHARGPKNLLRSRRWRDFERKMKPVWTEYIPLLKEFDAELRGAGPVGLEKKRPPEPGDESMRYLIALYRAGNREAMRYLKFRLEARRLYLAGKRLTLGALAKRVGVSRRTIFRRYHKQAMEAMSQAARPLGPQDRPEEIPDTLHEHVLEILADAETQPAKPTPRRGGSWGQSGAQAGDFGERR